MQQTTGAHLLDRGVYKGGPGGWGCAGSGEVLYGVTPELSSMCSHACALSHVQCSVADVLLQCTHACSSKTFRGYALNFWGRGQWGWGYSMELLTGHS
jgi:hypothetical protein